MYSFLSKSKIRVFAAFVLTLAILVFFVPSFSINLRNLVIKIFASSLKIVPSVKQYFHDKEKLINENGVLRKKTAELSLEIEQYKELIDENERLRMLLDFQKKIGFDTISAEIIARNPNDWIGSFIINKGSKDGVQKDSAICFAKGLLGKVMEVNAATSTVMLINHFGFKVGGVLKNTRINGVIVGSGKDTLKMRYLPIDGEVKKGETVLTSNFSLIFPKGIPIGKVVSVGRSKTGLYKYAIIKPFASSYNQEEVLCVK